MSFILGLIIGSFCNVCIHRIPLGENIVVPRSRCPNCRGLIRAYDNIPLLSFLFLKGQCRSCGHRISWQYPVVELLTGLLFALTVLRFGVTWHTVLLLAFVTALVIVTFIDLEHQIVPDVITLPGIAIALVWSVLTYFKSVLAFFSSLLYNLPAYFHLVFTDPSITIKRALIFFLSAAGSQSGFLLPQPFQAFLGIIVGGGLLYLVAVASRGGMGGGDIKLTAMIGALLGWRLVLLTIFLGTLFGSLIALPLLISGKKGRKDPMPFGPFLALGGVLALFWGNEIIVGYFRLFQGGL
ncbi:MAG: prepilin peptidase [Candidatus Methylomirabilales bacterium]